MNSPQSDDVFTGQIRIMTTMGFPDENINRAALHKTEGRINSAIDLIVSGEPLTPLLPGQQPPETASGGGGPGLFLNTFDPLRNRDPSRSPRSSVPASPMSPSTPSRKYRPLPVDEQRLLYQLHAMGFLKYGSKEEGKCRDALHRTKGNVDQAVALLLDSKDLDENFDLVSKPDDVSFSASSLNGWSDLSALNGAAGWPSSPASMLLPQPPQPSVRITKSQEVLSNLRSRSVPTQPYSPPQATPHQPPPAHMHAVPRFQPPPPTRAALHEQVPEDDPFADDYRI
ncbi:hypothetical protein HDU86_005918 [Geranomyces michiganensis]|nr:hypothetical protein HDU86_005918 [Geranomyces michiganensis]